MSRCENYSDFDVVIVGAGVTGATIACLLVARRLVAPGKVAVIGGNLAAGRKATADIPGAAPVDAGWGLRVYALNRASERLLRQCEVWDNLPGSRRYPYEHMCVWAEDNEPMARGALNFDAAYLGEPNLGHIVEGDALQRQCLQSARAAGVVLIEAAISGLAMTDPGARVNLSDGRELRGRLLVAADGAESKTRELLGIDCAGHGYHQDALVAHVRTARPHRNTAWQRFLRSGPLAFLPLPDGRSSIVWSVAKTEAAQLRSLDSAAFGAALTVASGGVLGVCELTTPVASFPLKLQYALDYARPRAVLVGDAAHTVHPLAGQGLNMGLMDCAVLADVLASAGGVPEWGDYRLLRRYQRWRKSENLLAAGAFDGLERLFSSERSFQVSLAAVGFDMLDGAPLVKNWLVRRALGLSGDLPGIDLQPVDLSGANEIVLRKSAQ
jgi:2-octaprenylphenol hydroxylase